MRLPVVLLTTALLAAAACGSSGEVRMGGERTEVPEPTEAISGYGLSLELPDGWDGRIYENETGLRVLQAANIRLVERDDDVGSESLRLMRSDGILIALWYWPDWPPADQETDLDPAMLPLQFSRSDFGDFEGARAPATAMRSVTVEGELVQVVASFGVGSPSDEAVAQANSVLATLRIR